MASQYDWILQAIETKKTELKLKYPDAVDDTTKTVFKKIQKILLDEKLKFCKPEPIMPKSEVFPKHMPNFEVFPKQPTKVSDTFYDIQVYNSESKGIQDWSFPAPRLLSWENHLIAIQKKGDYGFDFVFKNWKENSSGVPLSKNPEEQDGLIKPPNSIIRKVIVSYNPHNHVEGFRLEDEKGNIVLRTGLFRFVKKEITLKAEDRIVGFRSRLHVHPEKSSALLHDSLVIVVSRRSAT